MTPSHTTTLSYPRWPRPIFSLLPISNRAREALDLPRNASRVASLPNTEQRAFSVWCTSDGAKSTLLTIGRGANVDILLISPELSQIHCSFEIHPTSGFIMMCDRSQYQRTQFLGDDAVPFQEGQPRRILVHHHCNTRFSLGGDSDDCFKFEIIWHHIHEPTRAGDMDPNYNLMNIPSIYAENVPGATGLGGSRPGLRTPYLTIRELGSGTFGQVVVAVGMNTGKLMAVKKAKWDNQVFRMMRHPAQREVEIFSRLSHKNIVEYISHQGEQSNLEIFMGLEMGSVTSLLTTEPPSDSLTSPLFIQMLSAIAYLSSVGIIHRDIKPDNILYTKRGKNFHFRLADFGLSAKVGDSTERSGTPLFMAPEVMRNQRQTSKADIWSLFVTLIYILNVKGIRQTFTSDLEDEDVLKAVKNAAEDTQVDYIKSMAEIDPGKRPSAQYILSKLPEGFGKQNDV